MRKTRVRELGGKDTEGVRESVGQRESEREKKACVMERGRERDGERETVMLWRLMLLWLYYVCFYAGTYVDACLSSR